jgi:hypothetical protein
MLYDWKAVNTWSPEYHAEEPTICRMRDHFQTLLTEIAADPDRPISNYSLTPQSEDDDLISDFITSFEAP